MQKYADSQAYAHFLKDKCNCGQTHVHANGSAPFVQRTSSERPAKKPVETPMKEVAVYDYRDESGNILYQSVRYEADGKKTFRVRQIDGTGWKWTLDGVRKVLYLLPQIIAADKSLPLFIVEGEKCADALAFLGDEIAVTTNVFGAEKWISEYTQSLIDCGIIAGQTICIIPDNDLAGKRHCLQVGISILGAGNASLRVLLIPGAKDKGDIADWVEAGGTKDQFWAMYCKAIRIESVNQLKAVLGLVEESASSQAIPDSEVVRYRSVSEILAEIEKIGEIENVAAGVPGLNELTGGYKVPSITVIGGSTGHGKTTILLHEALFLAKLGHPVAIATLELSRTEIVKDKLCVMAEVSEMDNIRILDMCRDDSTIIEKTSEWMRSQSGVLTPVVVVDYAQRIFSSAKSQGREREVAAVMESFQVFSRTHNCIVIMGAQLNREAARSNGEPALHHFRESGLIEQVSDTALLLWKPQDFALNIIMAKNRNGIQNNTLYLDVDDWKSAKFHISAQLSAPSKADQYATKKKMVYERIRSLCETCDNPLGPLLTDIKSSMKMSARTVERIIKGFEAEDVLSIETVPGQGKPKRIKILK